MRTLGFFVFPNFNILDLSGPLAAFDVPRREVQPSPYRIVATQHLYVMRLPGSLVARLVRQHPALAVTLLRDVAGRLALTAKPRIIAAPGCSGTGT